MSYAVMGARRGLGITLDPTGGNIVQPDQRPGAWVPTPDGACCPPLADMLAHGYYDVVEQHQLDLNAKYGWPPNSCTALVPRGKWPPEWKCNLPNAMIIGNTRPAAYASNGDYIDAIRAGKVAPPTRFPALYVQTAPAQVGVSLISRVVGGVQDALRPLVTAPPPPAAPPPPPAGNPNEQYRAGCLQGLYAPNWCESVGLPGVPPFVPPPPPPPPPPPQYAPPPPAPPPPPPAAQLPQCPPGQYWGGYGCVPQGTTSSLLPQPYPPPGYPQPYAGGGWWAAQAPNTKLAIVGGGAAAALLLVFMATRGGA